MVRIRRVGFLANCVRRQKLLPRRALPAASAAPADASELTEIQFEAVKSK